MLPSPTLSKYGNVVYKKPYEVLFSLKDFNSSDDIVDKSGNNIPIVNTQALQVSSNMHGSYINFDGANSSWLSWKSKILDIGTNCEYYYKISGMSYKGGLYGSSILDGRPYRTNGSYILIVVSTNENSALKLLINVNNSGNTVSTGTLPTDINTPIEIRIRILKTGIQAYVNDTLFSNSTSIFNVVNQEYNIGRNAFYDNAANNRPPYLTAQLYEFEIRKLIL